VSTVGSWRGNALNELRRRGQRTTEQVDIVAMSRNRVTLVGEVTWRTTKTDATLLTELDTYKVPAMQQAGLRFAPNHTTLIISKGGYTPSLTRAARESAGRVVLLDVADILSGGTDTVNPTETAE
jgi:hypothetical protein